MQTCFLPIIREDFSVNASPSDFALDTLSTTAPFFPPAVSEILPNALLFLTLVHEITLSLCNVYLANSEISNLRKETMETKMKQNFLNSGCL